jgi:hypothetical protein
MIEVPIDAARLRVWWPWIVLSLGMAVITVGGALFSAAL